MQAEKQCRSSTCSVRCCIVNKLFLPCLRTVYCKGSENINFNSFNGVIQAMHLQTCLLQKFADRSAGEI